MWWGPKKALLVVDLYYQIPITQLRGVQERWRHASSKVIVP